MTLYRAVFHRMTLGLATGAREADLFSASSLILVRLEYFQDNFDAYFSRASSMASHLIRLCRQRAEAAINSLQRIGSGKRHPRSDSASNANQKIHEHEAAKKSKRKKLRKKSIERASASEATETTLRDGNLPDGEPLSQQTTRPPQLTRNNSIPERLEKYHTTKYEPVLVDRRSTREENAAHSKSQEPPYSSSLHQSHTLSQPKETTAENPIYTDANSTVDYTAHYRPAVCHETIRPQEHTIFQSRKTRSMHLHEHYYYIQPIEATSDQTELAEARL